MEKVSTVPKRAQKWLRVLTFKEYLCLKMVAENTLTFNCLELILMFSEKSSVPRNVLIISITSYNFLQFDAF